MILSLLFIFLIPVVFILSIVQLILIWPFVRDDDGYFKDDCLLIVLYGYFLDFWFDLVSRPFRFPKPKKMSGVVSTSSKKCVSFYLDDDDSVIIVKKKDKKK